MTTKDDDGDDDRSSAEGGAGEADDAESDNAESDDAESDDAESDDAESDDAESDDAESDDAESDDAEGSSSDSPSDDAEGSSTQGSESSTTAGSGASGSSSASSGGMAIAGTEAAPVMTDAPVSRPAVSGGSVSGGPAPIGASSGENQAPPDLDTCQEVYRSTSQDWCELQLECEGSSLFTYCQGQGAGTQYCECGGNFGYSGFQLEDVGDVDACQAVLEACTSEEEITFDGPPECTTDYQSASGDYCEVGVQCTQSAELGEGVSAVLSEYQYAYCNDRGDGSWNCQCNGAGGTVSFDLGDPPGGIATCNGALEICSGVAAAETSGPIECARTYQSANGQWCDAQIDCTQSADVGGVSVDVHANIWANCEQTGDTTWTCSCNGGSDSATFEVESADGWDSCSEASEMCPDLVDFSAGASSGGVGRVGVGRPQPATAPPAMSDADSTDEEMSDRDAG
jgi:hypothetical protein